MKQAKDLLSQLLDALSSDKHASALVNEAQLHSSPSWAAHMTPNVNQASMLGKLIAAQHNGNLLSAELYPQLKMAEQDTLNWLQKKLHFPHAYFTAGSSYGNLEALWQARDTTNNANVVYGSAVSHYSIYKACDILGLEFVPVASDELGRLIPNALKKACQERTPTAIVLNAGSTSYGEMDPLQTCISIAEHYKVWCHIDAAWGGALAFLSEYEHLTSVVAAADSLCFDPHKALGQPKPCGVICYKTPRATLSVDIDYLSEQPQKSLSGSFGGELFLPLWLNLNMYGENRFVTTIRARLEQAKLFADGLDKKLFAYHHSITGIVCFNTHQTNLDLSVLVNQGVFSQTKMNGKNMYRAVFTSDKSSAEGLLNELRAHL